MSRWRSALFVPADSAKLLEKAHQRGADAVILDLEDAVPAAAKPAARAGLADHARRLAAHLPVTVRVNSSWLDLYHDLHAAVTPEVAALVVPKVEDAGQLRAVSALVGELEAQRGLPAGDIGLVALIESPAALSILDEVAAIPRLVGLALGSEDFSLALGVDPSPAALTLPCQRLALAAAPRGLMALGLTASLANFRDLDAYRHSAEAARTIGMTGALCIHPAQVEIANRAFAASPRQVEWAERVVAAWEAAGGAGVISVDGGMVDRPVVERARTILGTRT